MEERTMGLKKFRKQRSDKKPVSAAYWLRQIWSGEKSLDDSLLNPRLSTREDGDLIWPKDKEDVKS